MKIENNCKEREHIGIGAMYLFVGNILRAGGNFASARAIYKQGLEENMPIDSPNEELPNWVTQIMSHLADMGNK